MEIELTYRYCKLDKVHEFGIDIINQNDRSMAYYYWVWFYIGKHLKKEDFMLYPWSRNHHHDSKVLYRYKYCNDAERQAKMIVRKINSTMKKYLTIIILLLSVSAFSQSLSVNLMFSGNGIIHTGISTQQTIGKAGAYFTTTTDETDGTNKEFNSFDKTKTHLQGFTAGINYQVNERLNLSAGMGRYKICCYAAKDTGKMIIFETAASVYVLRWLTVNFGVNSYPVIFSGIGIKVNF